MNLFAILCVVAVATGVAVADDSKGPKVTDKVGTLRTRFRPLALACFLIQRN